MTNVQVDLRSIVDLLSHHLYSDPTVVVRELLQNGIDALHGRRLVEDDHQGDLKVSLVGEDTRTLVVEDDGIGLDEEDITSFLSTIGRSSKRDELNFARGDYLGQFGIGLLSCFIVSDEITVITRKHQDDTTWVWRGKGDGTYTLTTGDDHPVGTSVYVPIRDEHKDTFTPEKTKDMVEHYGLLLPQRVTYTSDTHTTTVGGDALPWDRGLTDTELLEWGENLLGERFSHVVHLQDLGSESSGVAYIMREPVSPGARQKHRVSLKGMLLSDEVESVLPTWAFFARVVLDTRGLRPTMSREALVQDDNLESARHAFGEDITQWLHQLAQERPDEVKDVVFVHHLALKALAVHDLDLLRIVHPWLPVETSLGTLTIEELTKKGDKIKVARDRDTFRQLLPVCTAQGMCIVNGGYTYDSALLDQMTRINEMIVVETVNIDDLLGAFTDVPPDDILIARRLEQVASDTLLAHNCQVVVKSFRPGTMPVLHATSTDERLRREASETKDNLDGFWSSTMEGIMDMLPKSKASLCLNYNNDLVRDLARRSDTPRLRAAIELLYVQALLLGHQQLQGAEARLISSSVRALVEER